MKNLSDKIKLGVILVAVSVSFGFCTSFIMKNAADASSPASSSISAIKPCDPSAYQSVSPLSVVANPTKFLNKHIKIKAKFDKFSTLGLDYKPAYKSAEKYITFLIKREDVTDHTIPLSEMKNFLTRDEAEKYIDLSSGDEIEYCGTVFSDALGDAWVNVEKFTVLTQKSKDNKGAKVKTPVKK